jgi:hypothetical protein
MSIMRCDGCDDMVDTDYNVEGLFEDAKPYRFWCESCVMDAFSRLDKDCPIVAAVKVQDPEAYSELMDA